MKKLVARTFLWCAGWEPEGRKPVAPVYVLIAAPHTSAWDLPYLLALSWSLDVHISWMGKRELFRWPFGGLMRRLGGIPIHRRRRSKRVDDMIELLGQSQRLALVVPAEGTRGRARYWKSGFYRIALGAHVPIVMGYLDFRRKRGGFGPEFVPSGDVRVDMDRIRAFYADKAGKYPELFAPPLLEEEL